MKVSEEKCQSWIFGCTMWAFKSGETGWSSLEKYLSYIFMLKQPDAVFSMRYHFLRQLCSMASFSACLSLGFPKMLQRDHAFLWSWRCHIFPFLALNNFCRWGAPQTTKVLWIFLTQSIFHNLHCRSVCVCVLDVHSRLRRALSRLCICQQASWSALS